MASFLVNSSSVSSTASLSRPSEVCAVSSTATASVPPSSAVSPLPSSAAAVMLSVLSSVPLAVPSVVPLSVTSSAPVSLLSPVSAEAPLFPEPSTFSSPLTVGAGASGSVPCGSSASAVTCAVSDGSASTAATAAVPDASAFSAASACMLFIGMHADTVMIADIRIAVICFFFIAASLYLMFTMNIGYIIPIYSLSPFHFSV